MRATLNLFAEYSTLTQRFRAIASVLVLIAIASPAFGQYTVRQVWPREVKAKPPGESESQRNERLWREARSREAKEDRAKQAKRAEAQRRAQAELNRLHKESSKGIYGKITEGGRTIEGYNIDRRDYIRPKLPCTP